MDLETMTVNFEFLQVVGASCIFFLFLFNIVGPYFSEKYFPAYIVMDKGTKAEWNSRINSSLHSTIVGLVCVYCMLYDDDISKDPVWGNSLFVKTNCAVVIGYMVADTVILLQNWDEFGDVAYIFHHAASIIAFFMVITRGCCGWFANFRLIAEFSTPFVNQRWFLMKLDYPRTSPVYMLNGFALALMFFFCRILSIPPYYSKVLSIAGTEASYRLGNIWFVLLSTSSLLDIINVLWMYKIFRGVKKVLVAKFSEVIRIQQKKAKAA